jgi:hypothetical protein
VSDEAGAARREGWREGWRDGWSAGFIAGYEAARSGAPQLSGAINPPDLPDSPTHATVAMRAARAELEALHGPGWEADPALRDQAVARYKELLATYGTSPDGTFW